MDQNAMEEALGIANNLVESQREWANTLVHNIASRDEEIAYLKKEISRIYCAQLGVERRGKIIIRNYALDKLTR